MGREPEGLFRMLSHSALGTQPRHGRLFGVYASASPGALSWLSLNPKRASISSDVFRKRLKKSVRISTYAPVVKRLRWKPSILSRLSLNLPFPFHSIFSQRAKRNSFRPWMRLPFFCQLQAYRRYSFLSINLCRHQTNPTPALQNGGFLFDLFADSIIILVLMQFLHSFPVHFHYGGQP